MNLGQYSQSAAQPGLAVDRITALPIAVPPRNEQLQIAAFFSAETSRMESLEARVCEAVDRLKEYRTALISAAVTGKIDVREEVA